MLNLFVTVTFLTALYSTVFILVLQYIFKAKPLYPYAIAVFIAFILSFQNYNLAKVYRQKLFKYEAVEIKMTFKDNISQSDVKTNLENIMQHFSGHEKTYEAHIVYSKFDRDRTSPKTVDKAQTLPHYWKWENQTLSIYLSTYLTDEQIEMFQKKLNQRFFSPYTLPEKITVDSIQTSPLSIILDRLQIEYDKEISINNKWISHQVLKIGSKEYGERKAVCAVSFKLKNDFWAPAYKKVFDDVLISDRENGKKTNKSALKKVIYTQLSKIGLSIKLEQNKYKAFIHSDNNKQYLSLILENYVDEYTDDSNKPHILINPVFGSSYSKVEKDCFYHQLERFPLLEKIVVEKSFLTKFTGNPSTVSVRKTQFSPFYDEVEAFSHPNNY